MNNNQFKPVVGRIYQYSGHMYRCVNSNNRFKLNGQWYDGVLYEPEDKNGLVDPNQLYSRTKEDWMANFIPAYIEPKDYIIAESMGEILGIYKVQDAQYVNDIYALKIDGNENDYLMFERLEVQGGCQALVKDAGSIEHLRQNTLFFLVSEEYKNDIFHRRAVADAKSKLLATTRKFRRLNDLNVINQASRILEDFLSSIETQNQTKSS